MIKKCEICNKRIHKNIKYVQCSDCRKVLHFSCLNDSCDINSYSKKHFSCVKCTLQNLPFRSCFDVDVLTLGNNVLNSSQSTFINDLKSHQPSLQFNDIDNLNNINSHYVNIKEFNNIINSNTLEIVHLNIASLNKHIDELHNFLSLINKKINLIGITEHKLNASNSLYNGLPGYNFVFTPTISSHGGAGFFVSNNLNFKLRSDLEIKKPQLCESIFIEVNFNKQKNIIFGCIYRHPSTSITDFNENFLTPLLQKLSLEKISCCLMGDFNINLLKTASNTCVSVFYQMMSSSFFTPHILQPTRITSNTQTLIDNIFFNSIDFKTSSGNLEYQISDHLIQYLILDSFKHFKSSNNIIKRRCFRYFNHDEFQNDLLQVDWERISTIAEIDSCFENFLNSFEYLLDEHAPFKTFTKKEKSLFTKPWITNDIKNKMILRDKMFRKFCQCKNVVNKAKIHLEYKNLRNDIIQITKKSKLVYFHKYFQKNKLNISKTWEGTNSLISKKRKSHNSPLSVNHNGKLVNDLHDVVEIFNDFFINIGPNIARKIPKSNKHFSSYLNHLNVNHSIYLKPTDTSEIIKIINNLDNSKSLGPNSIPINILKFNVHVIADPLSKLINKSFEQGKFCSILKTAKVLPLFKKGDSLEASNYRPISLLSIFSKVFEKCMYGRVYNYLDKYSLIYKRQYGFRSKHSTSHALIDLIESIKTELDRGNFACGIFIDIQKAFDTVSHNILLSKLNYYGLRGVCNEWFESFSSNRKQFVFINGIISSEKEVVCRVPQGSTLGPLLFLIFINDLFINLKGIVFHFADDTNILYSGINFVKVQNLINNEMKILVDWLRSNQLSINESKTELLVFRPNSYKLPDDFLYSY